MSAWRYDVENMPKGGMVDTLQVVKGTAVIVQRWDAPMIIACSGDSHVTTTRWLNDKNQQRWEFFQKDERILAWQPWPSHPNLEASK